MQAPLFALAAGLVFGLGLIVSGMTDPAQVRGFLDVFGRWNPSLAFVMGGAIVVAVGAFTLAKRRAASGGVLFGIAHELKLPIRFIGVGESAKDLRPFDAGTFINAILPID